jgi:predicted ester cyclase
MRERETVVRRLFDEVINAGDVGVADELLSPDFLSHGPMGPIQGVDGFKQLVSMWRSAVADVHCQVDDYFEAGDMSAWVVRVTGTHTGEMMGIPATGRSFDYVTPNIGRWSGDRPAEHWADQGMFQFLAQIGALPSPQSADAA